MDRLSDLLDDEGDGRVNYRSFLKMVLNYMGDWTKRLPQVISMNCLHRRLCPQVSWGGEGASWIFVTLYVASLTLELVAL